MPYYRVYRLENVHPLGAPSTGSGVVGRRARRFVSSRSDHANGAGSAKQDRAHTSYETVRAAERDCEERQRINSEGGIKPRRRLNLTTSVPVALGAPEPGLRKLETQSKSRQDRPGRVAGRQLEEQEALQARSTSGAERRVSAEIVNQNPSHGPQTQTKSSPPSNEGTNC
jgi:hypothetical protein